MFYVIGDIHGNYERLKSLVAKINPKKTDTIVFLGDYVDRGTRNLDCLRYVYNLSKKYDNVICLKGNHESMMIEYLNRNKLKFTNNFKNEVWLYNGGDKSLTEFIEFAQTHSTEWEEIYNWVKNLPFIYQLDDKHMCAHAGYDAQKNVKDENACVWSRNEFYSFYRGDKIWLVGHTPVQNFGSEIPMFLENNIILLDTGSFMPNGKITCMLVDKKEDKYVYSYCQSD